jgi:hypothetical protein
MKRNRVTAAAGIGLIGLMTASCSAGPAAPTVPRLSVSDGTGSGAGTGTGSTADNPNSAGGDGSAARRARLHAAAQCIRTHGAPEYQDPLLTADGYVYTDEVGLRSVDGTQLTAIDTACHDLVTAANFAIRDQGPPPPKLIAAGVRSAQCMRANGLPDFKDPTVDSHFSPGKGFALNAQSLPAAGKKDPGVQRALEACRSVLDDEAALSSLGNLASLGNLGNA